MESLITRRALLGHGAGLGLTWAWPRWAPAVGRTPRRSLVVVWLAGGPSQVETWDPHPKLAAGAGPAPIDTRVEGLRISGLFPQVAEQVHKLSVIRSLVSKEGDHERATHYVKTGYRPEPTARHPALTAAVARVRPSALEIPDHVTLGASPWPAWGGFLGPRYDAFKVFEPGGQLTNLRSPIDDPDRRTRRRRGLEAVTRAFESGRRSAVADTRHEETIRRAERMMGSEQVRAFRLDDEPADVRRRYGDSRFGRGCLVARRLVERGVPAVEVSANGFDAHVACFEAHRDLARTVDPALASLIADLDARDLLRTTVLLCIGEFGRTPRLNGFDGRDHWPRGFACLVGGGGLRAGQLIGATDPEGRGRAPVAAVPVEDLTATVLAALAIDPEDTLSTPAGRPVPLSAGHPLRRLR